MALVVRLMSILALILQTLVLFSCEVSATVVDNPCVGAKEVLVDPNATEPGSLVSHVGFGNGFTYGNNLNCSWRLIAPSDGYTRIRVWFTYIQLEPSCDIVFLLSGNGTEIARFDSNIGDYTSPMYSSYNDSLRNIMIVRFRTDSSIVQAGFRLLYQAFPFTAKNDTAKNDTAKNDTAKIEREFQLSSLTNHTARVTSVVAARSDIECAVLCTAANAVCVTGEFRAASGTCVMYDRETAGLVKMP